MKNLLVHITHKREGETRKFASALRVYIARRWEGETQDTAKRVAIVSKKTLRDGLMYL